MHFTTLASVSLRSQEEEEEEEEDKGQSFFHAMVSALTPGSTFGRMTLYPLPSRKEKHSSVSHSTIMTRILVTLKSIERKTVMKYCSTSIDMKSTN